MSEEGGRELTETYYNSFKGFQPQTLTFSQGLNAATLFPIIRRSVRIKMPQHYSAVFDL